MEELIKWLDAQNIRCTPVDNEVVEIADFGKVFLADLSGVKSIFRQRGEEQVFNLMEDPRILMDEGIFHVAFPFGRNWYYYDLREAFSFNILKHIGRPKEDRPTPFVNLGIHTPFELLNASGDISVWIQKAKWLGHTALGICDRNTMAATLTLQKECVKAGIRYVFGYSFTLDSFGQDVDMKIYCQTQQGLQNLLQIQKRIMVESDTRKIDLNGLITHAGGNILVLGTLSAYWMVQNPKVLEDLKQAFKKVYYQVDPTEYKADRIDVKYLNNLKQFFDHFHKEGRFEIEPILIPDSFYPDADDAGSKIILNKIASGAAHNQSEQQYFRTVGELYHAVSSLFDPLRWDIDALFERMCRATVEVATGAEAHYEIGRMYMPRYDMLPEETKHYGDRRSMFLALLDEGLEKKIPPQHHPQYRERLNEEVYIIESTNNVDYFLIQWDMIQQAKRRGIVTGIGRGSAGGSLVAYLLGITSIDPLRYGLLFSRFLVPERCGLQWCEAITSITSEAPLKPGERYVEIEAEGVHLRLHPDAQLVVTTSEGPRTIYADELSCGDEIHFDRKDELWTLNELKENDTWLNNGSI